tara:strand:+ start:635 stop:958 length:324 start_codon:yes stop_codon:yes gene_type:complete
MTKVMVNGVARDMTAKEQAEYDARQTEYQNNIKNKKLQLIKDLRKDRLLATDWMSNSDVTMPDYIKTWRQTLRDLPQNNTTESQYDTLLARDSDGKFTNSVWTQPTE